MKQLYAIIILIFLFAGYAKSQETHGTQQSVTTQDEVNSSINIDTVSYTHLTLPTILLV